INAAVVTTPFANAADEPVATPVTVSVVRIPTVHNSAVVLVVAASPFGLPRCTAGCAVCSADDNCGKANGGNLTQAEHPTPTEGACHDCQEGAAAQANPKGDHAANDRRIPDSTPAGLRARAHLRDSRR